MRSEAEEVAEVEIPRMPRQRALESCVMQATARRLAETWRDRSRHIRRYAPQASEAWATAADDLERALGVAERTEVLDRLLTGLRQDIVRDLSTDLRGLVSERVAEDLLMEVRFR